MPDKASVLILLVCTLLLAACGGVPDDLPATGVKVAAPGNRDTTTAPASDADDVIARVGDQVITFGQLNSMLNSSAMVGLSVPSLGTPDRNRVIITLLDKVISANLLYLDARQQGLAQDPDYRRRIREFSDALLARAYRQQALANGVQENKVDVESYFAADMDPDDPLAEDARLAVEAAIRKEQLREGQATTRERLRAGVDITINTENLDPADDEVRHDSEIVATLDGEELPWDAARAPVLAATRKAMLSRGVLDPVVERRKALDEVIDYRLMVRRAIEAGLDQDPVVRKRLDEFRKTRLINAWRDRLVTGMEPTAAELEAYYEENRGLIAMPEQRKVQMVVLETREAADDIKSRIESGELTVHQAAREYSIDPNARGTLGDMGWVGKGSGFPELDRLTFSLHPGELGGPVQSPAGWHVVVVTDVRDGRYEDIQAEDTRRATRRLLLHDRLDRHAIALRRNDFEVSVDNDKLQRLFREEADMVAELERQAQQPDSLTRKREQEFHQLLQP